MSNSTKIVVAVFVLALLAVGALIIFPTPQRKVQSNTELKEKQMVLRKESEDRIKYFKDSRTDICFAYINSHIYGGDSTTYNVVSITQVPCDTHGTGIPLTESFE